MLDRVASTNHLIKSQKTEKKLDVNDVANRGNSSVIISSDVTITGNISTPGTVIVVGNVQGDIECGRILVQPKGLVRGSLKADDIDIFGNVEGCISGSKISLHSTSIVKADICYVVFEVDEGANVSGNIVRTSMLGHEEASEQNIIPNSEAPCDMETLAALSHITMMNMNLPCAIGDVDR